MQISEGERSQLEAGFRNAREFREAAAPELSGALRPLAFAGVAASWLFRTAAGAEPSLPETVLRALSWFAIALAADVGFWLFRAWRLDVFATYLTRVGEPSKYLLVLTRAFLRVQPERLCLLIDLIALTIGYWHLLRFAVVALSAGQ